MKKLSTKCKTNLNYKKMYEQKLWFKILVKVKPNVWHLGKLNILNLKIWEIDYLWYSFCKVVNQVNHLLLQPDDMLAWSMISKNNVTHKTLHTKRKAILHIAQKKKHNIVKIIFQNLIFLERLKWLWFSPVKLPKIPVNQPTLF